MDFLEYLQERIAKGRVIAVVGAGVSIAASGNHPAASWKGLLESGIQRCVDLKRVPDAEWAERKQHDLAHGDTDSWLSVATEVQERLRGIAEGEFRDWLNETVGALEPQDPSVLEALRDLGVLITTTNYDHLIETVTGRDPVLWKDFAEVQRVLQGDAEGVIHLHGSYKSPDSVVLGYRSYQELLDNPAAQALQQAASLTHSLLYIGFGASFRDPNFSRWQRWRQETFQGRETYRHFRLCLDGEQETVQAEHRDEERVFALEYGEDHGALAGYLRRLAKNSQSGKGEPPEPEQNAPLMGLPRTDLLLGRDRELAELVEHLCRDQPEPVPILGGPGMGKTALSVHAFRHLAVAEIYGQRRYFVRCDGITDASALPGAIATVAGKSLAGDPRAGILRLLDTERTLLMLDNFETPWDHDKIEAEAFLSELASLPHLALLISVRGQGRPYGVPWRRSFELGKLSAKPARELFLEITDGRHQDDPDLERVLSLLDGIPLALRLMAHAAKSFPALDRLLADWDRKRTALLHRGEGREDDLEVSIALSLDGPRLDEEARDLAARLALLPDGLAFEDLDALLPEEGTTNATALVDAGLAFYDGKRLRMLAPLREAIQRLRSLEETDLRELVVHFLDLARELGSQIGAKDGNRSVTRLEPEIGNLEACFRLGLEDVAPEAAFACRYGLMQLMRFQNIGSPALLRDAASKARLTDRRRDEANCIKSLGDIALDRSDHDGARKAYEQAMPLYRNVGDVLGEANCIKSLGDIALRRSDHDGARERYEQAMPLYRNVGDVLGEANCILCLGDIALHRSDHGGARESFEQALPLFRNLGSVHGEATCIACLGKIALDRSEFDGARESFEQALPLFRNLGDVHGEANCIKCLGNIALARSEFDGARESFEQALLAYRKLGSVMGEANCILSLGDISLGHGNVTMAVELWQQALELYHRIPEPQSIGLAHRRLAAVTTESRGRQQHLQAAREAWLSIDRADLVEAFEADEEG